MDVQTCELTDKQIDGWTKVAQRKKLISYTTRQEV